MELDKRVESGELLRWDRQVKISLDIEHDGKAYHICNYFCDFKLYYTNGDIELVEVKGYETDVYKLKRALLEATYLPKHPELTYTVVK